jgi:hypothetical protein
MFKFFRFVLLFFTLNFFSTAYADAPPPPPNNNPPPPSGETVEQKLAAALKREEDYKVELEKLRKPKDPDPKDDDDLRKKVQKDKETNEEIAAQTKHIERALGFNMRIHTFVKDNADLLPAEIGAIVAQADKETYDNAQAKASAMKKSIIESYFAIQANMEAITPAQKVALDDYLKLTKTGKEQKAADIYENIFEPALETTRKVKKAEEVGRSRTGFGHSNDTNTAYKDRLIKIARKTHLGEKEERA